MKIRNITTACIFGMAMLLAPTFSTTANAAYCNDTVIDSVSILPENAVPGSVSKYRVTVSCVDTARWAGLRHFYLTEDLGEAGYATVLTALSLGRNLSIVTTSYNTNSLLTIIKMLNP